MTEKRPSEGHDDPDAVSVFHDSGCDFSPCLCGDRAARAVLRASRPKLLDLYCCEGGASRGYEWAGFDVYGVDLFTTIKGGFSRKRYPYPAWTGNVLTLLGALLDGDDFAFTAADKRTRAWLTLDDFDAIHASPPCQHASAGTRAMRSQGTSKHPALIEPTRELLQAAGRPYVIENVSGAALLTPVTLCGTQEPFRLHAVDEDGTALEMWRHRLFETNWLLVPPPPCRHGWYSSQVAGSYGGARRDKREAREVRHGGYVPAKDVQQRLLGIDWMTERGMYQSLPPAYTRWIGKQLMAVVLHEREVAA